MSKVPTISSLEDALAHVEALETELHELRNQVNHQQRLASLGTIAAIIAHEFNNILTPMMAYAQMAVDAPADISLQHKTVRKALDCSERASRIAAAILNFAKAQDAASPFHVERDTESSRSLTTAIGPTIQSALECLARDPGKDGIQLDVDVSNGASVAMEGTALEQVVLNLILNARKAMTERGGALRIRTSLHESIASRGTGEAQGVLGPSGHPVWWHVEVEDTGCGMSADEVGDLFQPFATRTRAHFGTTTVAGIGLGLVVSKRLVEAVGGKIHVRSELGTGTCFTLILPAA